MAEKKVPITSPVRSSRQAEDWMQDKAGEPVRRLAIELPARLYAQVKAKCALEGVKMKDLCGHCLNRNVPRHEKPTRERTLWIHVYGFSNILGGSSPVFMSLGGDSQ